MPNIQKLVSDTVVGIMRDGSLQVKVSLRGNSIILTYVRVDQSRSFEVTFSRKAVGELAEIMLAASHTLEEK